ncbi:hypothetical protein ACXDCS_004560, partial [Escherichia coli]
PSTIKSVYPKKEQPDKGFLARISRGIMPSLPFL